MRCYFHFPFTQENDGHGSRKSVSWRAWVRHGNVCLNMSLCFFFSFSTTLFSCLLSLLREFYVSFRGLFFFTVALFRGACTLNKWKDVTNSYFGDEVQIHTKKGDWWRIPIFTLSRHASLRWSAQLMEIKPSLCQYTMSNKISSTCCFSLLPQKRKCNTNIWRQNTITQRLLFFLYF